MEERLKNHITTCAQSAVNSVEMNRYDNAQQLTDLIRQWERVLLGEIVVTEALVSNLKKLSNYYGVADFVHKVINDPNRAYSKDAHPRWPLDHPVVNQLIQARWLEPEDSFSYSIIKQYIVALFDETEDQESLVADLYRRGFTDEILVRTMCGLEYDPFYIGRSRYRNNTETDERKISSFGKYLLPKLAPKKGFLGLGKESGLKTYIDDLYRTQEFNRGYKINYLQFLADYFPEGLEGSEREYLLSTEYGRQVMDVQVLYWLLNLNPVKYETLALQALDESNAAIEKKMSVYLKLDKGLPGKYDEQITALGESHLAFFLTDASNERYFSDPGTDQGSFTEAYTEYLWNKNEADATSRIERLIAESTFLPAYYFHYLNRKLGERVIPLLMTVLFKDYQKMPSNEREYAKVILAILDKYDLLAYMDKLIEFGVTMADKKSRVMLAKTLSRFQEQMVPRAVLLLAEKTTAQREMAALLLSTVPTPEVTNVLNDGVDREVNDDTRDIMLETLQDQRFAHALDLAQVKHMIQLADTRKKMAKWSEKLLVEEDLPALYWKDGAQLTEKEIRFLFYRMKRSKGTNSDIEARQVIHHIDTTRSGPFAKALVAAFQQSNADSKLKYYLILGGLLGDDEMMYNLHMLFKKSVTDKRVKMAEYVIGALAMVGSDKALRIVESIYRKFANKKPVLSEAAKEALDAAAQELNITLDELGDRIVPTFDFDGLYKPFTIEGESFRAFINHDFKLNYFNEDNKLKKSLPANAPKELKTEFKEIEKEINDVVKTQPGRLEKCMLDERRWSREQWEHVYLNHPILFVYAMKLIWGAYDAEGNLVQVFYCTEDTTLNDVNDEEITVDDSHRIGILHPLHLTEEQLSQWKDKAYNLPLTTVFPILDRPVFSVLEEEKELNVSKRFFKKAVPKGADFVNTFLVKQNWHKGSGDGGRSEFTKTFSERLKAYASIEGPAAFYQGGNTPATVYEIIFQGKDWNDVVKIKNVPKVFYSEVMADIDQLINLN
ncbi:DUF4132 domain-containing protein [Chryseolinea lacunae]|uniref:DUF4132 domain-containing protein n=1 Tax=Chryseolinea lacunae TaxID=2801331 RepID=A0ABS1KW43_9BACT|nr:DUF4132 domain-containing protein [Chryseolinea lacunae]MBL0743684.1 DUF4132 domain-containing protein [Chryseolinea lacunae]